MAKQNSQPRYEEQERASGGFGKVILAVIMFGIAAVLLYISFAAPVQGTGMDIFRNAMRGLGGTVNPLLGIIFIWIGVMLILSARGKQLKVINIIMNALLFLCGFTVVQLFSAEYILENRMSITSFANFVAMSFKVAIGGGAIGALLAYPLYTYLGSWGGLIALVFLAAICLLVTGRAQKIYRWVMHQAEEGQHRSEQRQNIKKVERMFEYNEFDPEFEQPIRREKPVRQENPVPQRNPAQRPTRPTRRVSEPEREFMVLETPAEPEAAPVSETKKPAPKKKQKLYKEIIDPAVEQAPAESDIEIPKPLRKLREERKVQQKEAAKHPEAAEEQDYFYIKEEAPDETPFEPVNYGAKKRKNVVVEGVRPLTIDDIPTEEDDDDEPPFDMPEASKKKPAAKRAPEPAPEIEEDEPYNYPPIDLLEQGDGFKMTQSHKDVDKEKAEKLIQTLDDFGIETRLVGIAHGPAVTRFELMPAPGVKVSRITALADDITMHLAAMSVRIEAPIPGKAAVGVEIPNDKVEMVRLRDVLESTDAKRHPSRIAVGMGKDNSGRYIVADIAKMPHVLIAGQTGSGKSVCINSIITSILYRATPDEVRMILIDPKVVELSVYNDIPHLIAPVVTDPKKAASALEWAVAEMSTRYKKFAERDVRNIKGYNKSLQPGEKPMPQIVIVIDELADLMMAAPGEVEDSICRLAQLARAAGMHLVIATQRPSVNVITGIIKANIPTRIAFLVASQVDSRTIIDHGGAEKLLGNGDMLFVPSGVNKPLRVQGAWVSEEEVHSIVSYIKARSEVTYDEDVVEKIENSIRSDAEREEVEADYDSRLEEAVEIVVEAGQASTSMLQRRMRVGYARAGRLIDEMERRGIISEADGSKPRNVLISREQMTMMFDDEE